MSRKHDVKKQINDIELEIDAFEKKRQRSQSALLACLLTHKKPNPEDEEYFRVFTELIDKDRAKLKDLYKELSELTSQKKESAQDRQKREEVEFLRARQEKPKSGKPQTDNKK